MSEDNAELSTTSKAPLFGILAMVFAFICLTTPVIFLTLPLMLTTGMAVVAVFRKERPRWLAPLTLAFCALLVMSAASTVNGVRGTSPSNLSSAHLVDWSWNADPDFGTRGTIKWRVAVRNVSNRPIRNVKVEFSTYDKAGKLLSNDFSYVHAIPPGEIRDNESFADLYGTEDSGRAVISEVHFSDE